MEEIDNNYSGTSTPSEVKPENPIAFPSIAGESGHGNATRTQAADGETVWVYHNQGMTLRDYFAAKAMQAIISKSSGQDSTGGKNGVPLVASYAYEYADAMLAERNRN